MGVGSSGHSKTWPVWWRSSLWIWRRELRREPPGEGSPNDPKNMAWARFATRFIVHQRVFFRNRSPAISLELKTRYNNIQAAKKNKDLKWDHWTYLDWSWLVHTSTIGWCKSSTTKNTWRTRANARWQEVKLLNSMRLCAISHNSQHAFAGCAGVICAHDAKQISKKYIQVQFNLNIGHSWSKLCRSLFSHFWNMHDLYQETLQLNPGFEDPKVCFSCRFVPSKRFPGFAIMKYDVTISLNDFGKSHCITLKNRIESFCAAFHSDSWRICKRPLPMPASNQRQTGWTGWDARINGWIEGKCDTKLWLLHRFKWTALPIVPLSNVRNLGTETRKNSREIVLLHDRAPMAYSISDLRNAWRNACAFLESISHLQ